MPTVYWLEDLSLDLADEKCLSRGKWLTDNVINAAQKLLQKAYPHVESLQSTTLGEVLAFKPVSSEFVQVLNISHSHWVTISNIGCQYGCVKIYDSLPNCDVPTRTKEQIAALLFYQQKDITIEFPTMQVQHGSADCGLFALAFATTLCAGDNPAHVNYTQHLLHAHLYECFIQKSISPFPEAARRKKLLEPRGQVTYEVFCVCRLPEDGQMVQCSKCMEWYHRHCINAPEDIWNIDVVWHCCSC